MSKDYGNDSKAIHILRTIGVCILALGILVVAQTLAFLCGSLLMMAGLSEIDGNVLAAVLYPVLTFVGVRFLCTKVGGLSLKEFKIAGGTLKPVWCVFAVLMPACAMGILLLLPGKWEIVSLATEEFVNSLTTNILIIGVAGGIVEEMIFRGVIMNALERRWNKWVAVLVPSILFGIVHIIGNDLDVLSTIQLVVAGSVVGILFSLITYETGSIWCSALVHAVWNMTIGTTFYFGTQTSDFAIFQYIMDTDSFLLTGGDFGIECSVVSIFVYLVGIGLAGYRIKKKNAQIF